MDTSYLHYCLFLLGQGLENRADVAFPCLVSGGVGSSGECVVVGVSLSSRNIRYTAEARHGSWAPTDAPTVITAYIWWTAGA